MIHLITTVECQRIDWLNQFVRHYRKLGVERFWITLHMPPSATLKQISVATAKAKRILKLQDITYLGTLTCPFDAMAIRGNHDRLQAEVTEPHDWIVWADIDEFHIYPRQLTECLAEAEMIGATALSGEFIDRVALDGSLISFNPRLAIWNQFPVGCDITKRILKGQTNKVVCSKAFIKIKHANHDPVKGQEGLLWFPYLAAVHHFKWDSTVVERLKPRLSEDWKQRCHWWVQTQRFMDYLKRHKKINLDLLSTIHFPRGYQREMDEHAWTFVRNSREGLLKVGSNRPSGASACYAQ